VEFEIGSTSEKLVLYLSPDRNFLTSQLFDLRIDPEKAQASAREHTQSIINEYLEQHPRSFLGRSDAPVTLAVFGDFQCPFCRNAMQTLIGEVLPNFEKQVRVAFFHYPLASHGWARPAAEWIACLETEHSFWPMVETLYQHQPDMRSEDIRSKLLNLTSQIQGVDSHRLTSCFDSRTAVQVVQNDTDLGEELGVGATPTFFVNGLQLVGAQTAQEFRDAIANSISGLKK
jgi:protein-disulfide isomerase